jgi:hypothetical protein
MASQRVLTVWGLLPQDQDPSWGYNILNSVVNAMAEHATLHSVSHTLSILPTTNSGYTIQISATVLYTGPSPRKLFGTTNPNIPEEVREDTNTLQWEL